MTATVPVLSTYLPVGPRPAGIPVASFAMQKVLTKAIRSHATNQNLRSTAIKSPDKIGGKRGGPRAGRAARTVIATKK